MEIRTFEPVEYKDVKIYVRQYDKNTFEYLFFHNKQIYTYPYGIKNTTIKEITGQGFNDDQLKKIVIGIQQEAVKVIDALLINQKIADKGNQLAHRAFINKKLQK